MKKKHINNIPYHMIRNLLLFFVYSILCFASLQQYDFKENIRLPFIALLILLLALVALNYKKLLVHLFLYLYFSLVFVLFTGNFIIDLVFPPTIPAVDCKGHIPINGNWIRGMFFGIIISISMIPFWFRNKTNSLQERITALIVILVLISSILMKNQYASFYHKVNLISRPIVIYPEDC